MRTRNVFAAALGAALTLMYACGLPPMKSDTGYRGTWSRGNEHNTSIVAITEAGGRWYFRWTKRSHDGSHSVLCDWDGRCTERLNGKVAATYTITTRFDPASGLLGTDTVEERTSPTQRTFRYSDVMAVADNGQTLWNYTTDRDGQHFDGAARPQRSFAKISNSVAEPPRPERP